MTLKHWRELRRWGVLVGMCASLGCGADDGLGMSEAERLGFLTLSQGDSSRLSPLAQSSLFITNLAVVNDPSRTNPDPCLAVPADAAKKWNLGYLLAQASSTAPTAATASTFVSRWLTTWSDPQTVNGQALASFGLGPIVKQQWRQKSGGSSYKMEFAPFRLSAIVPRFDLRKRRRFGEGLGGELRFVFGHVDLYETTSTDGQGKPRDCASNFQSTVILEYAVDKQNENQVRAWAEAWRQLSTLELGSGAYLSRLEELTQSVVKAGAGSAFGRPNGSALIRIRTTENPTLGGSWVMREWNINPSSKLPEAATVKQSPMFQQRVDGLGYVGKWAAANAEAIRNDTYVVPNLLPEGGAKLGAEDLNDSHGDWGRTWQVGFNDGDVRHLFGLGTCVGCHSTETSATTGPFFHISARGRDSEALLSDFIVGPDRSTGAPYVVPDPVTPWVSRSFDESGKREKDLLDLTSGMWVPVPVGIKTVGLATYFKVTNWNSGKCVDVNGGGAGAPLVQWPCHGNGNQRFAHLDLGTGYHQLRVKQGSNYCLQAEAGADSSGKWLVKQQTCSTATSQQAKLTTFAYHGTQYHRIQFRNTGRCLELPNTNDLTRVEQKACGDVFQQYFYLVE